MKKIIERLRAEAKENIEDGESIWSVKVTNAEALRIADALEQTIYPTAVTAAISRLNYTQLDPVLRFAAVDRDSGFYAFDTMPVQSKYFCVWHISGVNEKNPSLRARVLEPFNFHTFDWEQMLFHRTANGWEWHGDPNKQN